MLYYVELNTLHHILKSTIIIFPKQYCLLKLRIGQNKGKNANLDPKAPDNCKKIKSSHMNFLIACLANKKIHEFGSTRFYTQPKCFLKLESLSAIKVRFRLKYYQSASDAILK